MPLVNSSSLSLWMHQILDNPSILSDFNHDLSKRSDQTTKEGIEASKKGDHTKANFLFGKAEAYTTLLETLKINLKESESQNAFQSQQKPGSTAGKSSRARSSKG